MQKVDSLDNAAKSPQHLVEEGQGLGRRLARLEGDGLVQPNAQRNSMLSDKDNAVLGGTAVNETQDEWMLHGAQLLHASLGRRNLVRLRLQELEDSNIDSSEFIILKNKKIMGK